MELSAGDLTCGSGSPVSTEIKVDGQCNEVTVNGATVVYKATPLPPDAVCMNKYEEYESEVAC